MYDYYDEPYYEPSAADIVLSEYQDKMREILLDSVKLEIESIKNENKKLKQNIEELRKRENEVNNKERELERQKKDLMQQVKKERLSKLMEEFQVIMYRATTDYVKGEKCDKCDENRKIHFTSPSGKDCVEDCLCNVKYKVYVPEDYYLVEFSINTQNGKMSMWFDEHKERDYDYYRNSYYANVVYSPEKKFEELDEYKTFFRTKEECQAYCDWLNSSKIDNNQPISLNTKAKRSV